MTSTVSPQTGTAVPRWRTLTTQILSGIGGLLLGLISLPVLVTPWFATGADEAHLVHGIGWGIAGGLLVAVGLLSQVWRPTSMIAGLQMALIGILSLGVSVALGLSSPEEIAPFLVVGLILAAVHPARDSLFEPGAGVNRPQALLAALGALPFGWYALQQAAAARAALPGDPHIAGENHYETMAAMGIGLVLVGLLGAARTRGWRLPTIVAGVGTAYFGLASIASGAAGSVGPVWGAVALAGGVAYLLLGLRDVDAGSGS